MATFIDVIVQNGYSAPLGRRSWLTIFRGELPNTHGSLRELVGCSANRPHSMPKNTTPPSGTWMSLDHQPVINCLALH